MHPNLYLEGQAPLLLPWAFCQCSPVLGVARRPQDPRTLQHLIMAAKEEDAFSTSETLRPLFMWGGVWKEGAKARVLSVITATGPSDSTPAGLQLCRHSRGSALVGRRLISAGYCPPFVSSSKTLLSRPGSGDTASLSILSITRNQSDHVPSKNRWLGRAGA